MKSCLSHKNFFVVLLCAAVLCLGAEAANGKTITVKADGTGDYPTIQNAIDASIDGDIIELQSGTYTGDGNRKIDFLGKAITLKSENGPENCVIDCGYRGGNWYIGISLKNGERGDSVIAGLTITGAYGAYGAAIACRGSSPVIKNCILVNNISWHGGIVGCHANSNPTLINCAIVSNICEGTFDKGGVLYCKDSSLDIINCTIMDNSIQVRQRGGPVYCEDSTVSLVNSIIWGNSPETLYVERGSVGATYSCIQGDWPGDGNISNDPLLTANAHLQVASPCINLSPEGSEDDIDGEERPVDTSFDIGCDEFVDADNDALADWWEMKYFGSIGQAEPTEDPDQDDEVNLEEYVQGTNPLGAYYVDAANGNNGWDGCAAVWDGRHGPKATIQAAINSCGDGDTIILAEGTYTGDGNRDIDFRGKAVTVVSNSGPEFCIIDCQAAEGNEHRGFYFHLGEGPNSIVDGMTITNGVAFWGGGIYCDGSNPTIRRCDITGNYSRWRGGGGIYCYDSSPHITDCVVSNNRADLDGGAIFCELRSNAKIRNCTISGNVGGRRGGVYSGGSNPKLTNCILWDNRPQQIYINNYSSATVSYCDIQGGQDGVSRYSSSELNWGEGNIDEDPYFVEPGYWDVNGTWIEGDYHLLANSPCIDAGDPNYIAEPNEIDLDGNPRVADGDGDGNSVVDMGAYEFFPAIEVSMRFTPPVLNPGSQGNWVKAHFILPDGYSVEDVDSNIPANINPGGIESDYINVFINEDGLVEIEIAFDRAAFCGAAIDDSVTDITVVGRLTNGEYFYGTDTIRIINNSLRYLAVFAFYWLEVDCGASDWCSGVDLDQNTVVDFVDFALLDGCCIEVVKE